MITFTFNVESSLMDSLSYNEKSKTLRVHYKTSNSTYEYSNVPKEVFEAILNADSKDKELRNQIINGCFNSCKISCGGV